MGENAKIKAESLEEVKMREMIKKTMLELDGVKQAMGENAKIKAESLEEVKMREMIKKTMLELDGCLCRKSLSME
ncbi:hypothetical protein Glove_329g75 [Diversispora epigaea]|uniref:Uncharacterized protein n=1 Tax=Diversispora epigaea TaxID=1348612 RepID=A0A397HQD4_9GLOM|nr:hypothetical protein Glove_329g75 [Diversispora epigaea]